MNPTYKREHDTPHLDVVPGMQRARDILRRMRDEEQNTVRAIAISEAVVAIGEEIVRVTGEDPIKHRKHNDHCGLPLPHGGSCIPRDELAREEAKA